MQSVVYGCIPIIVQDFMAQPFHEFLPYSSFSLHVDESEIDALPEILRAIPASRVRAMQSALRCVAPRLLWSSVVGAYGNETGQDDAFATVLDVLRKRKARAMDSAQEDNLFTEVGSAPLSTLSLSA